MQAFIRAHKRKLIAGHTIVITAFILSSALALNAPPQATLFFMPYGSDTVAPGAAFSLDVDVYAAVPVNAFDVTITYPAETLEMIGTSEETSFLDLWPHKEAHTINDGVAEYHFTAGTVGRMGLVGTGTALTLNMRAKEVGTAELLFRNAEIVASDGKGSPVTVDTRSFIVTIRERLSAGGAGGGSSATAATPTPSPDIDGDGAVTIIDVSIFLVQLLAPYNPRYDLTMDGSVSIGDLSVLLSKLKM